MPSTPTRVSVTASRATKELLLGAVGLRQATETRRLTQIDVLEEAVRWYRQALERTGGHPPALFETQRLPPL